MKTREIEVWVDRAIMKDSDFGSSVIRSVCTGEGTGNLSDKTFTKARLLIEVPEKKIEITESQFDEAWKNTKIRPDHSVDNVVMSLKEELFGKDGRQV